MTPSEHSLLHMVVEYQVFINELLLLIDYDSDINHKRSYDGYIKSKKEHLSQLRSKFDSVALQIKE